MAISLQDFFKSLVGGVLIITTSLYTVGDRVELEQRYGDVI
ncbi:MAG: mechanosensitive ion channel domain-containing protein [Candidatus Natronoplasma sp.]